MSAAGWLLLRESTDDQIEILNEETSTGRNMYIEGPFVSCEMKNRNGRVYPKGMMESVIDQYVKEYVNEKRGWGEFIHPDYPLPNPKKAALKIESLEWRGNLVYGKAKVLDKMEEGKILRTLIEEGFRLGVSTRGMGKLGTDRSTVEAYRMNAIDAVDMPSGQPCYFDVVNESTLWFPNDQGGWVMKNAEGQVIEEATQSEMHAINHQLFLENLDKALHRKIYG